MPDFIPWLLALCGVLVVLLFFSRQVKSLLKIIFRALIGAAALYAVNFLLGGFGLYVGVNAVTLLVIGLLGAPGFLTLYAASAIL
jgi:pro-sigmaK processing inhibitor BofA